MARARLQVLRGGETGETRIGAGSTERGLNLLAVLPTAANPEHSLHEAAVLDAMFDPALEWESNELARVMRELERFDRCPESACRPYVRARLASPFAGSKDDPRSLHGRVDDLERLIVDHFGGHGIPRPRASRRRLLVAAYLLLHERTTPVSPRAT